jgi:transposase
VISSDLHKIYNEQSADWCAEAKAFSLLLLATVEDLEKRLKVVEDKLAINSNNSSTPSSQDSLRSPKKRSMRTPSGKKPGGQPGHKGQGGKLKDRFDDLFEHKVTECPACKLDMSEQEPDRVIRKQVEDLPPVKTIITEHRIELKTCACCEVQWEATGCPAHIRHEFQYGPRIKALSIYLSAYQFIPSKRIQDMLAVFGVNLSTGTLDNFRISAANRLKGFVDVMRQSIIDSVAGFFDETGIKVSAVGHWVHVAATSMFSLFMLHPKRGREAHDQMGILSFFCGVLHRDDYHSYRTYDQAEHSLCNAHLIRDLKFAIERDNQQEWAEPLIELLLKIKSQVDDSSLSKLNKRRQKTHRKTYNELIDKGLKKNPPKVDKQGKTRGKTAQTKSYNLLLRFRDKSEEILRFMVHADAEFTNNDAERALRMNKIRQKISGGFRSEKAGKEFMVVRSFIATAIKRGADPVQELIKVFSPDDQTYMRLAKHPE